MVLTLMDSVNAQVNEMQLVREKVYQMEQTHMTLKQKFVYSAFPCRALRPPGVQRQVHRPRY